MCTSSEPVSKPVRCPICGKPSVDAYRPFCSKRCADIDLAKWFGGAYAVPGREEDEGDGGAPRGEDKGSETDER
jgi:endogenous inhibitor of DNA gyrase (YacG/DUF329 family)